MKKLLSKSLPLLLAGILQVMPMLKTVFLEVQALTPSSWAMVLRLGTGAVALLGFHATSSASSIAISPVNATNGVPYVGTVTYSGSHAGEVSSMTITNLCMTSARTLAPGLSITYSSVNKATVSGTPTTTGSFPFTIRAYDGSCGSGDSDPRSATLVVGAAGGGNVAPSMVAAPQSLTAQVGSDVLFSAGASGNPVPKYSWYLGLPSPSTLVGTNSSLTITNVQYTNSGLYTVTASNSVSSVSSVAYLSVCSTAGSNILALNYTNYAKVSNAVVMSSYITNTPTGSNVFKWQFNFVDITSYSTNGNNLSLAANTVTAAKSGIYTVVFKSTVGGTTVVPDEAYNSYWAFGVAPAITASPQATNVLAGSNVTLSAFATVQQNPYGNNLSLGFLWYLNGTNLVSVQNSAGTNQTANLNLSNVAPADAGLYTVVVTNYWGSTTSAPALLTVSGSPLISSQPASKSALVGQTVKFSVVATGSDPLSYQWRKGLVPLSNGGIYSGVTSNTVTLTGLQVTDADVYSVIVTNAAGSTTSSNATLAVFPPPTFGLSSSAGTLQLNANTVTGLTYVVQTTMGLDTPTVWVPITTNVVPANGTLLFTNAITNPQQYFRLFFP